MDFMFMTSNGIILNLLQKQEYSIIVFNLPQITSVLVYLDYVSY